MILMWVQVSSTLVVASTPADWLKVWVEERSGEVNLARAWKRCSSEIRRWLSTDLSDSTLSVEPLSEDRGEEDEEDEVSESGEALLSEGLPKPLRPAVDVGLMLLRMSTLSRREVGLAEPCGVEGLELWFTRNTLSDEKKALRLSPGKLLFFLLKILLFMLLLAVVVLLLLLLMLLKVDSLLKARNVLRISVLLSGEALRRMSFDLVDDDGVGDTVLLFFLRVGEGEPACLFRSTFLKGEELRAANLCLAALTLSSLLSLADLAGECSLIRVGFPGPMVIKVLTEASSVDEPRSRVADTLRADLRLWGQGPVRSQSGSMFSFAGEEQRPAPRMKPFSERLVDASRVLVGL